MPEPVEATKIGINFNTQQFYIDSSKSSLNPNITGQQLYAPVPPITQQTWNTLTLRIIIDHSVIEVCIILHFF